MNPDVMPEVFEEVEIAVEPVKPKTVVVANCRYLNVRKAPNQNGEIIATVKVGTKLQMKTKAGKGWCTISNAEIPKGYVRVEFVKE